MRGGSPADPGGAAAGAAGSAALPGGGAGATPPGTAAPEVPPAEPPRLAENRAPGPAVPAREEPPATPRRDAPPPARLEEMAERLGVPEADRPRLFAVQRRFFTATQEQRVRLDSVRREIRAELLAAASDRDRIDGLLRQAADLQVGLERAFVDHVLAAREVLDGEAEARYLHFLSQLAPGGPRQRPGIRGPAAPGRRRPGDRPPRRFGPGG